MMMMMMMMIIVNESSYQEQTQLVSKVPLERIFDFVLTLADQHGYPPVIAIINCTTA